MKDVKPDPPAAQRRPADPTDFDINVGLHNLQKAEQSARLMVWKAPVWGNLVCLVFLLIALLSGSLVAAFNPELFESTDSAWEISGRVLVAGIFFLGVWFLASMSVHRARLELNHDDGCLLFYRRLVSPKPFHRIRLADIAAVRKCTASDRASGDDSAAWTYKIVAAELKTGELVSIAFDSSPDILSEIRKALPESRMLLSSGK